VHGGNIRHGRSMELYDEGEDTYVVWFAINNVNGKDKI